MLNAWMPSSTPVHRSFTVAMRQLTMASLTAIRCFVPRFLGTRAEGPVLNQAIKSIPRVRLVSETGEYAGVMSGAEALAKARAAGRDVMQVRKGSADAEPVVKLLDYEAYEQAQRRKAYDMRKKSKEKRLRDRKEAGLKQLRLSPSTDPHDLGIKLRHAQQFLIDGYKVRIYMQFRRGQGRFRDNAVHTLAKVANLLSSHGTLQGAQSAEEWLAKLTAPAEEDAESEEPDNSRPKKPLEVLFQPLPKKMRGKTDGKKDIDNVV